MAQPQRHSDHKKFDLSAVWSCGPKTSQWASLWTRLLSYALPALQEEATGADSRTPNSDFQRGATGDAQVIATKVLFDEAKGHDRPKTDDNND